MIILEFEWDEFNTWKPLKHGVTMEEVEEVFANKPLRIFRAEQGRYIALGITDAGRYLKVPFEYKTEGNIARPITAFNMDEKSRKLYKKKGKGK